MRGLEAAHSRARILHAGGDATGAAIEHALVATVRRRAVRIHEHTMLVDLLVGRAADGDRVTGARLLAASGGVFEVHADAIVLATGGAGQLFRHTTNPDVATGDGVAAAWRAGAEIADLEFVQFHPTALAAPGTPLISEAVRGEGAVLRDADGHRFLADLDDRAELAPRDVVARAVWRRSLEQGGVPVTLDATSLGRDFLDRRFPGLGEACRDAGYDWAIEQVPVTPAAHYAMGGVVTDLDGRTSLPGLFAVGETARTGVHGANRLASNSLLEAAVFADRAARALDADGFGGSRRHAVPAPSPDGVSDRNSESGYEREALQDLMWERVGLERTAEGLAAASAVLDAWHAPEPRDRRSAEDRNLLELARLTVAAAAARTGSIGAHFRADAATGRVSPASPTPTGSPTAVTASHRLHDPSTHDVVHPIAEAEEAA